MLRAGSDKVVEGVSHLLLGRWLLSMFGSFGKEAARSGTFSRPLCLSVGEGWGRMAIEKGLALGQRGFEPSAVTYRLSDLQQVTWSFEFQFPNPQTQKMESTSQGHHENKLRSCWQKS